MLQLTIHGVRPSTNRDDSSGKMLDNGPKERRIHSRVAWTSSSLLGLLAAAAGVPKRVAASHPHSGLKLSGPCEFLVAGAWTFWLPWEPEAFSCMTKATRFCAHCYSTCQILQTDFELLGRGCKGKTSWLLSGTSASMFFATTLLPEGQGFRSILVEEKQALQVGPRRTAS